MLKHTTIPDFDQNDTQSMATTVRAMKEIVETLAGLRQGEALGAPQIFIQSTAPAAVQNSRIRLTTAAKGDLWINDSAKTFNYFDGTKWVELTPVAT